MQVRKPSGRKPGTRPRGDRSAITVRVPTEHARVYEQSARDAGYASLSDYLGALLAREHRLPEPEYIHRPSTSSNQTRLDLPLAM